MKQENSPPPIWAFLVLLLMGTARAEVPFSPEQTGLGDAGVARTDSSGLRNAAAMMLMPGLYSFSDIGWGQGFHVGQAIREVRLDSPVGASLGYSWGKSNLPPSMDEMPGWIRPGEVLSNERLSKDIRAAGGFRALNGRLGVGAGMRYLRDNSELGGAQSGMEWDLSVAGLLAEGVSLAVGGRNLLQDGLDPFSVEVGLWWSAVEAFNLALDAVFEEGVVEGRAGAEIGLSAAIRLRGGYRFSELGQSLGAGVGLLGEGTRLDYALSLDTVGENEGVMTHSLAIFIAVPTRR
jgi:hypothetical protein